MAVEVTQHYTLPPKIERCRPSGPCAQKAQCLRYLAPLPEREAIVADFGLTGGSLYCVYQLPPGCEEAIEPAAPKAAKPWPTG